MANRILYAKLKVTNLLNNLLSTISTVMIHSTGTVSSKVGIRYIQFERSNSSFSHFRPLPSDSRGLNKLPFSGHGRESNKKLQAICWSLSKHIAQSAYRSAHKCLLWARECGRFLVQLQANKAWYEEFHHRFDILHGISAIHQPIADKTRHSHFFCQLYLQSMFAIITVNGIFKEMNDANENQDNILGFSRTFVLKKFASGLVSMPLICHILAKYCIPKLFASYIVSTVGPIRLQCRISYHQWNRTILSTIGQTIDSFLQYCEWAKADKIGTAFGRGQTMSHDCVQRFNGLESRMVQKVRIYSVCNCM